MRSRLYVGSLIFISLTMIYFYTTSLPQLSFRLHFFNDDTQLYSNNKESHAVPKPKVDYNTYTVFRDTAYVESNVKTSVNDKTNVKSNVNDKSNDKTNVESNVKSNVKSNVNDKSYVESNVNVNDKSNVKTNVNVNDKSKFKVNGMTNVNAKSKVKTNVNTDVRTLSNVKSTDNSNDKDKFKSNDFKTNVKSNVKTNVDDRSNAKSNNKSDIKTLSNVKSNVKTNVQNKSFFELKTKDITAASKKQPKPSVNNTTQSVVVKITKPTKYLIYLCDSKRYCGGFGDRQRGIAYAFMAAIQLDRKFGIVMSTPCDVRQFFIPNKYNWIIPESDLIGKPQKLINSVGLGGMNLSNDTTEVIYLRTNAPGNDYIYRRIRHKLPPYLKGGTTRKQIFKLIWESLMKPSRHVINHLKTLALPENMTCAHVRIGKSKNLPNDPARNKLTSVPKLWDFMEKFNKANTLFVATDNIEVRDSARRRFTKRYFDSEGKILHIDRQKGLDADCLGFETSIIDQIILSKCSVLIISRSSFSFRAAMLGKKSKDLYSFHGTSIKPFKLT